MPALLHPHLQAQLLAGPRCAAAGAAYQPAAAAAAAGARPYSSSALESLQEAAAKLKKAAASSANAVRAAGSSVSHAPDALYNALPKPAQQLVNAAQVGRGRLRMVAECATQQQSVLPAGLVLLPCHPACCAEHPIPAPCRHPPPPTPTRPPQMPGAVNRVLSLQLTAFWQNHSNAVVAAGAAGACYALWRGLLAAGGLFVDVGEGAATGGMLALAASGVAFGYLYLRRRYTIDPQVGRLPCCWGCVCCGSGRRCRRRPGQGG